MDGLSRQDQTSVKRKGQGRGGTGSQPSANLARNRDWDGDQKDRQKARRRDHSTLDGKRGAFEAIALLAASAGGTQLNTAFIERLNATFRERLASLTRRCRHAARKVSQLQAGMWLVGCTYNWCWPHHELSRRAAKAQACHGEIPVTPAMASGLTDHVWSVYELLTFRIPPPAWVAPKRRGRPRTWLQACKRPVSVRPRPLLRLRKGGLCPSTV
jgi:hypothetical protein